MTAGPADAAQLDAARRAVDLIHAWNGRGAGHRRHGQRRGAGDRAAAGGEGLSDITGIPTSNATRDLAREVGIPLTDLSANPRIDLTIDGADEVTPTGDLIKGLGGALLREKLVAVNSRRLVIVVDEAKLVKRLGAASAASRRGGAIRMEHASRLSARARRRPGLRQGDGGPFLTDDGHYIIDARFPGGINDPPALADVLARRPGVVETGLFLGMAPEVLVGRG